MKTKGIGLLVIMLIMFSSSFAQTALDTLKYADWRWSLKKKALVLNYLHFTEAEKSSFWPIFDSYNNATRYFELESLMILKKYSDRNGQLSDRELEDMSQQILRNDLQLAKLRKSFYKKFKEAVSPEQATAFFQIDMMFRSMLRLEAQRDIASAVTEVNLYSRN
jgi:hypothetical protein